MVSIHVQKLSPWASKYSRVFSVQAGLGKDDRRGLPACAGSVKGSSLTNICKLSLILRGICFMKSLHILFVNEKRPLACKGTFGQT